jgi:hypothetical protein
MGQAYDDRGRVLGSASGETMRDVFNELLEKYPNAASITVRRRGARSAGEAMRQDPIDELADDIALASARMDIRAHAGDGDSAAREAGVRPATVEQQRAALNRELRYRGGL